MPYRTVPHTIPDIILSVPYPTKNTYTNLKTKKHTNSKIKNIDKKNVQKSQKNGFPELDSDMK